ncbi:MAG: tripartite tricarboxylate transporter TctB family protein [Dehalococcoidia bacterium]
MKLKPHEAFTLVIGLIFAGAVLVSLGWSLRASVIILVLGGIAVVLAMVQLALDLRRRGGDRTQERPAFDVPIDELSDPRLARRRVLEIWGWLLGLFAAIHVIGFLVAVPLFTVAFTKLYRASWFVSLALAAVAWGFLYGLFDQVMHVPWPDPLLWRLFSS